MFYFQKIEEIKLKEIELKKSTEVRQLETFGKIQSQTEKKKKSKYITADAYYIS